MFWSGAEQDSHLVGKINKSNLDFAYWGLHCSRSQVLKWRLARIESGLLLSNLARYALIFAEAVLFLRQGQPPLHHQTIEELPAPLSQITSKSLQSFLIQCMQVLVVCFHSPSFGWEPTTHLTSFTSPAAPSRKISMSSEARVVVGWLSDILVSLSKDDASDQYPALMTTHMHLGLNLTSFL